MDTVLLLTVVLLALIGIVRIALRFSHSRKAPKKTRSWDEWFDGEGVSSDFMSERDQPDHQQRK